MIKHKGKKEVVNPTFVMLPKKLVKMYERTIGPAPDKCCKCYCEKCKDCFKKPCKVHKEKSFIERTLTEFDGLFCKDCKKDKPHERIYCLAEDYQWLKSFIKSALSQQIEEIKKRVQDKINGITSFQTSPQSYQGLSEALDILKNMEGKLKVK